MLRINFERRMTIKQKFFEYNNSIKKISSSDNNATTSPPICGSSNGSSINYKITYRDFFSRSRESSSSSRVCSSFSLTLFR